MAGSITVSGMSAGELAGERIIGPITMVGKAVIGETIVQPLAVGDNTFAVPTEAVAALIIPTGEVNLRLRTSLNTGDSGLSLSGASNPFVYTLPSPIPTSLILNSSGAGSGVSITFI